MPQTKTVNANAKAKTTPAEPALRQVGRPLTSNEPIDVPFPVLIQRSQKEFLEARNRATRVPQAQIMRDAVDMMRDRTVPVLGTIQAGRLSDITAEQDTDHLDVLFDMLGYRKGSCFFLRAEGDCLNNDGILHNDWVMCSNDAQFQNGAIAAVLVEGQTRATLKHVYVDEEQETVELRPSNPNYDSMTYNARDVIILGIYQSLVRHK